MLELITFMFVAFGMTQIVVYGSIFENIRPTEGFWGKLFNCTMCSGFWVGFFLWSINGYTELFTYDMSIITGFCLACLSSGTSYGINSVISSFEF